VAQRFVEAGANVVIADLDAASFITGVNLVVDGGILLR
jgi:NAD(P)-dependent dehydrogenase (short-subunit alcohol dehydrogenase family)